MQAILSNRRATNARLDNLPDRVIMEKRLAMKCPKCGRRALAKDTFHKNNGTTQRTRVCENGHRFYTVELVREYRKEKREPS